MSDSDPADQLAQQRARKINRMSTLLVLLTIAVLATATWYIVKFNASPVKNLQEQSRMHHALELEAQAITVDGQPASRIKTGDILRIRVDTTQPVYAAVMAQAGTEAPLVLFRGVRIPPGQNRVLEKADRLFEYPVEGIEGQLTLCLVYGLSEAVLMQVMRQYVAQPDHVENKSCFRWNKGQIQ